MEKPSKETLLRELDRDGDDYFSAGRFNNIADIVLSVATVGGSLAATVLASAPAWLHWIAVGVAAVPAACATIQNVVDVRGRSEWYFENAALVRNLGIQLKYADDPRLEDFARMRGELEVAGEITWKKIGRARIRGPV